MVHEFVVQDVNGIVTTGYLDVDPDLFIAMKVESGVSVLTVDGVPVSEDHAYNAWASRYQVAQGSLDPLTGGWSKPTPGTSIYVAPATAGAAGGNTSIWLIAAGVLAKVAGLW